MGIRFCPVVCKFIVTISFAIPVLLTSLHTAVLIDIGWGLLLLVVLSFPVSEYEDRKKWRDILEHLLVAILVVALSYGAGEWINARFF